MAILHDEIHPVPAIFELQDLHIYSGTSAIPTATVKLLVEGVAQGKRRNRRRPGGAGVPGDFASHEYIRQAGPV